MKRSECDFGDKDEQ